MSAPTGNVLYMAEPKPEAGHELANDQIARLNQEFYSGSPHYYLRQRMYAVVLMCGQSFALAEALQEPVWLDDFGIQGPALRLPSETAPDYAAMEAVVLFHHAAEAMFRLYFAHEDLRPCPWLEVSRRDRPGEFKQKVQAFADSLATPETQTKVMSAFRGPGAAESANHPGPVGEWMIGRDGIVYLLGLVARYMLNDAPLYNAAKHGLTVVSRPVGVKISVPGEAPFITTEGPALTFLRAPNPRETGSVWAKQHTWIKPSGWLKMTELIIREIESIWSVARANYLGDMDGKVALVTPQRIKLIEDEIGGVGSSNGPVISQLSEALESL